MSVTDQELRWGKALRIGWRVRTFHGKQRVAYFMDSMEAMSDEGWRLVGMQECRNRVGLLRLLLLGPFATVFHPHPTLVVSFERHVSAVDDAA